MNYGPGTNVGGGRWYPTLITLANGEVLALGGHPSKSDPRHHNNTPEIYSPKANSWRFGSGVIGITTSQDEILYYPRVHLLPNGLIFFSTPLRPENKNGIYNLATGAFQTPLISPPPEEIYRSYFTSSVLLPLAYADNYKPRVLICGGGQPMRIDLSDRAPAWQAAGRRSGNMASRVRGNVCPVFLPTGDIFLSGGIAPAADGSFPDDNAVLEGEIYSPGISPFNGEYTPDERWTTFEKAQVPRNYHSVALLMPDGCIFTAGSSQGGRLGTTGERRIEIYRPNYWNDPLRPRVTEYPSSVGHTQSFQVKLEGKADMKFAAFIRLGSCTHAYDSDQRYIFLRFTQKSDRELEVVSPPNGNIAPPGYYMLWLIDGARRPCLLAPIIRCVEKADLPNGKLAKERSRAEIYVIYGGARFYIPTPDILNQYGGSSAVEVFDDGMILPLTIPRDFTLLREQTAQRVHVVYGGAMFYIPDRATFDALRFREADIRNLPDGQLKLPSIPLDFTILKPLSPEKIYVIFGGAKFYIPNEASFLNLGFRKESIRTVPVGGLDHIEDIPRDGTLLKELSNDQVFIIYGKAKFYIPSKDAFVKLGLVDVDLRTVPDGGLNNIGLLPRDGTLLKELDRDEIFQMRGGRKCWIPSMQKFEQLGLNIYDIRKVPNGGLTSIPDGAPV